MPMALTILTSCINLYIEYNEIEYLPSFHQNYLFAPACSALLVIAILDPRYFCSILPVRTHQAYLQCTSFMTLHLAMEALYALGFEWASPEVYAMFGALNLPAKPEHYTQAAYFSASKGLLRDYGQGVTREFVTSGLENQTKR
jgi:hypothetical protein